MANEVKVLTHGTTYYKPGACPECKSMSVMIAGSYVRQVRDADTGAIVPTKFITFRCNNCGCVMEMPEPKPE